jgi:hypothetical protein
MNAAAKQVVNDLIANSQLMRAEKPTRNSEGVSAEANLLALMEGNELTPDEVEQISDPAWAEPGLFAEGHVIAVVAKPNGGKTTICFHIACTLADRYSVVYVDSDTNPGDAKRKLMLAKQHGVRYLTPDLKVGKSMRDVVGELEKLSATDIDLTGHVWFFDTLKKMANVIHKDALKNVLGMMRRLSGRGMTCVLLAHTNKYKNSDGEYQYEGTGDLESDVDELIYFEPRDNDDGTLTVSTRCQKRRAEIAPRTWDINADRTVTARGHYVDVVAEARAKELEDEDAVAIDAVRDGLAEGPKNQTELVKHCAPYGVTAKRLRKVLRRYRGKHWLESPLGTKNAKEYRVIPRLGS